MSKIFGEIQTTEDLNELANNLRKTKEFDEIRLLCTENGISMKAAEEFIKGDRLHLVLGRQEVREAFKDSKETIEGETAERIRKGILITQHQDPVTVPSGDEIKAEEKEAKEPPADHTFEDVKKKLEAELEIYRDGDSKYVVEKLIELCQKDKVLLEAIMLPHKSYDKAFQYFYQQSRTVGYKMPHGNMVYLDNDAAVNLSVEYFKKDDAAEAEKKSTQKPVPRQDQTKSADNKTKKQPVKSKEVKSVPAMAKQTKPPKKESAPRKKPLPKAQKPKAKEIDGQLSLFDF